jgi:hypothetical protein
MVFAFDSFPSSRTGTILQNVSRTRPWTRDGSLQVQPLQNQFLTRKPHGKKEIPDKRNSKGIGTTLAEVDQDLDTCDEATEDPAAGIIVTQLLSTPRHVTSYSQEHILLCIHACTASYAASSCNVNRASSPASDQDCSRVSSMKTLIDITVCEHL